MGIVQGNIKKLIFARNFYTIQSNAWVILLHLMKVERAARVLTIMSLEL